MSNSDTREKVRRAYAGAALRVVAGKTNSCCGGSCGAGSDDPITGNLYIGTTEEVQDAHPAFKAFAADFDELACGTLEPRGHHVAIVMPHGFELVPHCGIAEDDPVFDYLANGVLVVLEPLVK